MKRFALLGLAVVLYSVAAWMVAPGFYDGPAPSLPYNFTCPPAQAGANQKPLSGHRDVSVAGGVSDADSVSTDDGQFAIGFLPGAFDTQGKTTISVDVKPLATCPTPAGIVLVTNVYQVTADATLVKASNVDIRYSNLLPDPGTIYQATDPAGPWTSLSTRPTQPYLVSAPTTSLGYFAAGYKASSRPSGFIIGGGQVLPIVVALLIVIVVLAGLPLAVMRRRRG